LPLCFEHRLAVEHGKHQITPEISNEIILLSNLLDKDSKDYETDLKLLLLVIQTSHLDVTREDTEVT